MVRKDLTVVYYTNNRERPNFERRIKKTLLKAIDGLPLISVSQKPIDFGKNICVGRVGHSSQNAWRQLQIGAMEAKTPFICPAEADFVYPPEYFQFIPEREDLFYLALPVWLMFCQTGGGKVFCQKPRGSEAAMTVGRECLIKRLDHILEGRGHFGTLDADGKRLPYLFTRRNVNWSTYEVPTPIVTFKTDWNIHRKAPHEPKTKTRYLEGIGHAHEFLKKYMG